MTCHIFSSVGAVRFSNSKASWCLGRITQVFPDKVSWIFRLREKLKKTSVCVCVNDEFDIFTYMLYIKISSPVSIPKTGRLMYFVSCFMTSISLGQGRLSTAWIIWRRLDGKRVPWIAYWRLQMMRERALSPLFAHVFLLMLHDFRTESFSSRESISIYSRLGSSRSWILHLPTRSESQLSSQEAKWVQLSTWCILQESTGFILFKVYLNLINPIILYNFWDLLGFPPDFPPNRTNLPRKKVALWLHGSTSRRGAPSGRGGQTPVE